MPESITQQYCISARNRKTGMTSLIHGPMSRAKAEAWKPQGLDRHHYKYFRISKYPFTPHLKDSTYINKK